MEPKWKKNALKGRQRERAAEERVDGGEGVEEKSYREGKKPITKNDVIC